MKREEQIKEAAAKYCATYGIGAADVFDTITDFVEGAEWADQHPNWIPVEEELPKHKDVYIVYEGKNMVLATFCPSDNTWWESEDDKIISVFPTHWMPIVLPKGGDE